MEIFRELAGGPSGKIQKVFPVISIQGLIWMKPWALGREKDFRDIQLILEKYPEYEKCEANRDKSKS